MPQMNNDKPSRACKCLNVRIWDQPHAHKPPDFLMGATGDSEYTLTYVGERGISIVHPQLTMRTKKMGPPIADSPRCIRFTTLTCLLCQTLAYRVLQSVVSDVDRQEGPLLPSPDWVEQETLLSSSGWIEVHNECLLAEDVTRLSSSSTYSSAFGIVLPQNAIPPVTQTQQVPESPQEPSTQTNVPTGPFLHNLKPLLPPAPFVPSHPIFTYLSSIAVKASEHRRSSAEEQIASIVRDKLAELETADDALRHDVEELWRKFVENMSEVERQLGSKVGETRKRDTSRGLSLCMVGVPGTPLVSVRNFVPTPSTAPRVLSPSSSHPRISTLSASLATSGFFHQVRTQEPTRAHERSSSNSPRSPPPYSSHPSSLGSAESSMSSSLQSSPVLSPRMNGDSIVQPFKRSMDESRDVAVSFKYFTILEDDVTRSRRQQITSQPDASREKEPKTAEPEQENRGDSNTAKVTAPAKEAEEAPIHPTENPDRDVRSPTDGTPRKRVQFDIKVDAATDKRADSNVNYESRREEELIFDLDDGASDPGSSDAAPVLPFVENAQASRNRGRHRVAGLGALPASLSSLRPTSLPAYSVLHSGAHQEQAASVASRPTPTVLVSQAAQSEHPEQQLDPQEEEILRLVAANTPSHRSAWKRNSKAWQLFVSRRRNGVPGALIPEESEDGPARAGDDADDDGWGSSIDIRWSLGNAAFPASLPIEISPLSRQREPLSLASYQPKTSLAERTGMIVSTFTDDRRHASSTNVRKASYAERDRSRAIDPGLLGFVAGEVEDADEGESDEEHSRASVGDEERGRKRAFKILQARSKIPAAGMWMSLA